MVDQDQHKSSGSNQDRIRARRVRLNLDEAKTKIAAAQEMLHTLEYHTQNCQICRHDEDVRCTIYYTLVTDMTQQARWLFVKDFLTWVRRGFRVG